MYLIFTGMQKQELLFFDLTQNSEVHRHLAETGFDVKLWLQEVQSWERAVDN